MRAVARRLEVPHTWVGKVEQAERRIDIAEYIRFCEALHVNPHDGLDLLLSTAYEETEDARKKSLPIAAESRTRYGTRS